MYLLFVLSLLPAVVVSADDLLIIVCGSITVLETEQEKTLGGQLDATGVSFSMRRGSEKLADENPGKRNN